MMMSTTVSDIEKSASQGVEFPCHVEVYRKPRTDAPTGYVRVDVAGDKVRGIGFALTMMAVACPQHFAKVTLQCMCVTCCVTKSCLVIHRSIKQSADELEMVCSILLRNGCLQKVMPYSRWFHNHNRGEKA